MDQTNIHMKTDVKAMLMVMAGLVVYNQLLFTFMQNSFSVSQQNHSKIIDEVSQYYKQLHIEIIPNLQKNYKLICLVPVSYTHLTLPTILRV